MFGTDSTDNLHFALCAKQLGAGLDEQLHKFVQDYPDTRLIIIDTLQKVREIGSEKYSYAGDYEIVGRLKQFADRHDICLLLVHHTRKQQADDKFDMISGTMCRLFSSFSVQCLLSSCWVFSCCVRQAPGQAGFRSCSTWAQWLGLLGSRAQAQ